MHKFTEKGLPDEFRDMAEEIAKSYVGQKNVESVLLIGSVTAGFGNPYSDLDLYIISDDARVNVPTILHKEGMRIDVENRPRGWLEKIVREAADFTFTTGELSQLLRSNTHFDTVGRLYYATPLVDHGEFARAHTYLLEHFTEFRRYVMAREVSLLHGLLEDCLGALLVDDVAMASMVSQELLRGALQTFLVGCGSVYLGKKWIPARLRSVATKDTPVKELLLLCTGSAGLEERGAIAARIRFAQTAVAAALTDGWSEPGAARWNAWPSIQSSHLARSLDWMAVRVTDAIVLIQVRGKQFKVPENALRMWGEYPSVESPDESSSLLDRLRSLGVLS